MPIVLQRSKFTDLQLFAESENLDENKHFVIPYNYSRHQEEFQKAEIEYLSIHLVGLPEPQGYIILNKEDDARSIEFRRIIVFQKENGIGTKAIVALDDFCRKKYGAKRIWLDVFSDNLRGIHIYEKAGYKLIGKSQHQGRGLLVYEKQLP